MPSFFSGVLTIIALFVLSDLKGQDVLTQKFGVEEMNEIQGTYKHEMLQYQNLHGYAIQDLSGIKDVSEYPDALGIPAIATDEEPLSEAILTSGNFELFAYEFPIAGKQNSYYRVGDSGILLIIYSTDIVKEQFDKQNN